MMCLFLVSYDILSQAWGAFSWIWYINIKTSRTVICKGWQCRMKEIEHFKKYPVWVTVIVIVSHCSLRPKCQQLCNRNQWAHRALVAQCCMCLFFMLCTAYVFGEMGRCVHDLVDAHKWCRPVPFLESALSWPNLLFTSKNFTVQSVFRPVGR